MLMPKPDYEEMILQISDVMRAANKLRPILSHEQAVKNIRGIVERHGKWIKNNYGYECSECSVTSVFWGDKPHVYCHWCGAKMDL